MWVNHVEVIDSFSFDARYRVREMAHVVATRTSKAKTAFIHVVLLTELAARTSIQGAGGL